MFKLGNNDTKNISHEIPNILAHEEFKVVIHKSEASQRDSGIEERSSLLLLFPLRRVIPALNSKELSSVLIWRASERCEAPVKQSSTWKVEWTTDVRTNRRS